jgi:electron transport complex protein RnfC
LQPQELYWFAQAKNFEKAAAYHLFDCIECGACTYVCPSRIPLVQYYRFAKSEISERNRERAAAATARERHEFRIERIERDKREKAEKLAQKEKANADAKVTPEDQAVIQAALERAKQQTVT